MREASTRPAAERSTPVSNSSPPTGWSGGALPCRRSFCYRNRRTQAARDPEDRVVVRYILKDEEERNTHQNAVPSPAADSLRYPRRHFLLRTAPVDGATVLMGAPTTPHRVTLPLPGAAPNYVRTSENAGRIGSSREERPRGTDVCDNKECAPALRRTNLGQQRWSNLEKHPGRSRIPRGPRPGNKIELRAILPHQWSAGIKNSVPRGYEEATTEKSRETNLCASIP